MAAKPPLYTKTKTSYSTPGTRVQPPVTVGEPSPLKQIGK